MKKLTLFALLTVFNSLVFSAEILRPTSYSIQPIPHTTDCAEMKSIVNVAGAEMVRVCKSIYRKCTMEGTCALLTSHADNNVIRDVHTQVDKNNDMVRSALRNINMINYVQLINKIPRFEVVNKNRCPFGLGARSICLDPFYTVAADLKFHNLGDVIFIPSLKGVVLPNGEAHSGFMIVRDKGGAIKDYDRFDFFLGFIDYRDNMNPFYNRSLSSTRSRVPYRRATEAESKAFRRARNFPKIPMSI